jgi:hypothetical protein
MNTMHAGHTEKPAKSTTAPVTATTAGVEEDEVKQGWERSNGKGRGIGRLVIVA